MEYSLTGLVELLVLGTVLMMVVDFVDGLRHLWMAGVMVVPQTGPQDTLEAIPDPWLDDMEIGDIVRVYTAPKTVPVVYLLPPARPDNQLADLASLTVRQLRKLGQAAKVKNYNRIPKALLVAELSALRDLEVPLAVSG